MAIFLGIDTPASLEKTVGSDLFIAAVEIVSLRTSEEVCISQ